MNAIEAQVRALADREAIRELVARYALGVALGEGAAVAALFTDDAAFVSVFGPQDPPLELRGRQAIDRFYGDIQPNTALPYVHNHVIHLAGDAASGRCMLEVQMIWQGRAMIGAACYDDRYRREEGRWRFAERHCRFFRFEPRDAADGSAL